MIRYELKDKVMHNHLAAALPEFTEALQRACRKCGLEYLGVHKAVTVTRYAADAPWAQGEWAILLPTDDIEVLGKYDPKKWNKYPDTTPPEGQWMRCEGVNKEGQPTRRALIFIRGKWRSYEVRLDEPYYAGSIAEVMAVDRFRPWDEESAK